MMRVLLFSLLMLGLFSCKKRKYKAEEKSPEWGVETYGDTGWSSPCIGLDGTIYVGDAGGYVTAANSDGTVKWQKKLGADFSGGSVIITSDGSKLIVPEMEHPGRIFCLDPATGDVNWEYTLPIPSHLTSAPEAGQLIGGGINSTPSFSPDESTIYFGTGNWVECNPCSEDIYDDRFFALDISGSTGVLKWVLNGTEVDAVQHEDRVSFWASPSIAPDGTIYIGNFNGFLYHIEDQGANYNILHRFNFDAVATPLASGDGIAPEIWSSCAINSDGTIYTQSNDGRGWAFNPDLTVKWQFDFFYKKKFWDNFTSPVITPNGLVVMGNEYGYLLGIDGQTGEEKWRWPKLKKPLQHWWRSGSINANGEMIIGSEKGGEYYVLDCENGKLLWQTISIGNETGCFPAIADDGTIYVTGGYDGGLYAFDGNGALAGTPWPKGLKNNRNTSH